MKSYFLNTPKGKTRSTRRKTSRSKGETRQQTQPTYGVDAGIWILATFVAGELSHHCAILGFAASCLVLSNYWTFLGSLFSVAIEKDLLSCCAGFPGAGGTPLSKLYEPNKYVPLQRVWFNLIALFGLETGNLYTLPILVGNPVWFSRKPRDKNEVEIFEFEICIWRNFLFAL